MTFDFHLYTAEYMIMSLMFRNQYTISLSASFTIYIF